MTHNSHHFKRLLILNIITHLGPISRTELIDMTDYRPATISDLIKELLDEDLISETGFQSVGHGRKRTLLEINKQRLCAAFLIFFKKEISKLCSI
ncbi:MAG: MarR family transcriptional regulator [Clostridia bacterium]|nr:MarR family transcriptional regulator [Clostridia bacterium]